MTIIIIIINSYNYCDNFVISFSFIFWYNGETSERRTISVTNIKSSAINRGQYSLVGWEVKKKIRYWEVFSPMLIAGWLCLKLTFDQVRSIISTINLNGELRRRRLECTYNTIRNAVMVTQRNSKLNQTSIMWTVQKSITTIMNTLPLSHNNADNKFQQ